MKLALALSERADIQCRIMDISERLNRNAKVQEGEKPSEEPLLLIEEMEKLYMRLEELIIRINRTNNETKYGDEMLVDMLAKRDCLKGRIKKLRAFLSEASALTGRY